MASCGFLSQAGIPTIAAKGIMMSCSLTNVCSRVLFLTSFKMNLRLLFLNRCNNDSCLYVKLSNTVTTTVRTTTATTTVRPTTVTTTVRPTTATTTVRPGTFDQNTVFANSVSLDWFNTARLEWNHTQEETTFRITVRTTGWLGFGISPTGAMGNSNVMVVWRRADGTVDFRDASAVNRGLIYDGTSNWRRLFYRQLNGATTVIASRRNRIPSNLAGARNVDITPVSSVIYAHGTLGFDRLPAYHFFNRGGRTVALTTTGRSIN